MINNSYSKKVFRLLPAVILLSFLLSLLGCKQLGIGVEKVEPGSISFIDFVSAVKIRGGNEGVIDFGGKEIGIGGKDVKTLKIKNSGTGDLVINDMFFKGGTFNFVEGTNPDFPVVIPAGKTIDNIYLEFNPKTSGEQTGQFFIVTGTVTHNFDLVGTGLWVLTLSVPATGDDSNNEIVSPGTVIAGETKEFTSDTGIFQLKSNPGFLYEFVEWTVDGTPDVAPVFDNVNAEETTVVLKSHASMHATINNPFVRVPDDETNINTAISTANGAGQSVVIRAGTYNVNYDINLLAGVHVYGGYNTVWSSRNYKLPADRTDSTYATIINFTDTTSTIKSGSGIGNDVVFEGFTIQRSAASSIPLVSLTSDTKAVFQYNTIVSNGSGAAVKYDGASALLRNNEIQGGTGAAVFITNLSSPRVESNDITGGSNSADDSKTYGIEVSEKSSPVIYKNSISGGTSSGLRGQAYGIFNDFECNPIIVGNTINGGSAAGDSGKTYGVYLLDNGKGTIGYNDINGGSGNSLAYALYVGYGGNLYLDYNNIHTSVSSDGYGIYIGWQGRVRRLLNNAIYAAPAALLSEYLGDSYGTIDEVNDAYNTDTNTDSKIEITIPDDPNY
ncbi:MAG: right-handed parallel beta-helix repeat-containing protein [Spirochaetes bacterium]|nr:right-handed parallel beta-helix repeat-containing protein [Spirochaetota bacterium]